MGGVPASCGSLRQIASPGNVLKLIIQIPCYNEEHSLPVALAELPRELPGIDTIEWLIVNDGSSDRTVEIARQCGVDHIVDLPVNRGLAHGFMAGLAPKTVLCVPATRNPTAAAPSIVLGRARSPAICIRANWS